MLESTTGDRQSSISRNASRSLVLPLLELLRHPPARTQLCELPSPLESHPGLADGLGVDFVLVKRDDLNGTPFGGNKIRALEWLLPACQESVLTMGGFGSTWCAALAAVSAARGLRAHVALFPQPWTDAVAGALSTSLSHAQVTLSGSRLGLPLALVRARRRARADGRVTWLPAGGATPMACLGSVNAALELARQCEERSIPRPDAIVVPFGSGATAAGLLVGLWLSGWNTELCAVRVTDPWFASPRRLLRLAARVVRLLATCGLRVHPGAARLRVLGQHLGGGYGHPTNEGGEALRFMSDAGLVVDPTYTAKAAAALRGLAASFRRLLFWHTFDRRLLSPPLYQHPLFQAARTHSDSSWPLLRST